MYKNDYEIDTNDINNEFRIHDNCISYRSINNAGADIGNSTFDICVIVISVIVMILLIKVPALMRQ